MSDYKAILPPVLDSMKIELPHFPTRMQALIFRLWEMVPAAALARILRTDAATVTALAMDMGLREQENTDIWQKSGYITIIRAAWHLLPYEQLLDLLGWDAEQLAFTLREDDFLRSKLGNGKFDCEPILYAPLTADEQAATARLRAVIEHHVRIHDSEITVAPFDFFAQSYKPRTPGPRPADCPIDLRDGWTIRIVACDARTAGFVEDFRADMARWGVEFVPSGKPLTVTVDVSLLSEGEETHEVRITADTICVTGASPVGILRGLSHLCTLADAAGGPFFKPFFSHRKPSFDARFIYSYCGLFGTVLDTDTAVSYPDELLKAYARAGVNGVWLQAVLYKVTRFPFDPALSEGWEQRQARLRDLVERAARRGIRVYLYINEPRAMPLSFFDTRPELCGHVRGESASLCTSHPEVQAYLRDSITDLCTAVPGLGGFFTISVSENQTNCYSHAYQPGYDCGIDDVTEQTCPRCLSRQPWDVVAEANSIIADAAYAVDPSIKTFVWTWGWGRMGREGMHKAIELLSPNCIVQNTSEERMALDIGGVKSTLSDYTMSRIPPSESSRDAWEQALATGHQTSAKVQLNCTWEASTAPYIPVYENILEHIRRLREIGVGNLQLSWTLGGWPSENLKIASSFFFADPNVSYSYDEALRNSYGAHAPVVKAAVHRFCEAFSHFPFYVISLYRGPQNAGPANILFAKPSGLTSTTTCYAYDDLENWRSIYPVDVYTEQFRLVAESWQEGLRLLDSMPDCDFKDTARVCGALFCASYNQIRFVQTRDAYLAHPSEELRRELLSLIADEKRIAEDILVLMYRDARIGYEAANHYLFSRTSLMEKIINCAWLERHFAE